ncbi:MAG: outer membrane protein assembly factor BamD [Nitrospirota bacterium]
MKKILACVCISILFCAVLSCSGKSPVRKPAEKFDPEKTFTTANAQFEKKEYEQARASFLEVKNRDLTKQYAPLAQLKIADSYVKEEEPELAVAEYRKFLEAYPDHQYASYAQYQIAMVYFDQIEGSERGYGGAAKALEEFEKLKTLFPRNPYKDVVDLKIEKCRNTIAEYEYLVGQFYYKKGSYNAALGRFEGLLEKYPDYKGEPEVLFYSAMSYKRLGRKEKANEYFSRLVEKYPNNKLSGNAKKELSALQK